MLQRVERAVLRASWWAVNSFADTNQAFQSQPLFTFVRQNLERCNLNVHGVELCSIMEYPDKV